MQKIRVLDPPGNSKLMKFTTNPFAVRDANDINEMAASRTLKYALGLHPRSSKGRIVDLRDHAAVSQALLENLPFFEKKQRLNQIHARDAPQESRMMFFVLTAVSVSGKSVTQRGIVE